MKNPERTGSGRDYGTDPGGGSPPVSVQCCPGWDSGDLFRLSETCGKETSDTGGSDLFRGCRVDLDLYLLCCLPGGYQGGVSSGDVRRAGILEFYRRKVAAAGFLRILAFPFPDVADYSDSMEKIFLFCKNFVCICGKMGYNSMYESFQITSKAEKGIPWHRKASRKRE